jgi:hypothetical protein
MSQVIKHSKGKIRPPKEPRPMTVRIEHGILRTTGWFVHRNRARRIKRAARPNVDRPKKWRRRLRVWILEYLAIAGALVLLAWLSWAAYVVYRGEKTRFETYCDKAGTCGVLIGFTTPFLTLAAAASIFLIWRLWRVTKPIARKARTAPRELVPTAGTIVDRIVGRDELCLVIMEVLRDRDNRRPYLLVGGVGTGKTAVLVQLTKMLEAQKAIPVPIRLRDADEDLDFDVLARKKFVKEVDAGVLPSGFAERVWRQLRLDDRVVVLADGLEEAFVGAENEKDRDNFIRMAIEQARKAELPLVIASRPHHPLEATQAAMMELEPLSEEAALDYIERESPAQDEHRLDWIVETADVADAPLYLQITRQLYEKGLLEHLTGAVDGRRLDTRGVDRSALRWRLLDTWRKALVDGHLHPELAVDSKHREEAIEYISALACIGLHKDRLEVSFEELTGGDSKTRAAQAGAAGPACGPDSSRAYPGIWSSLNVSDLPERVETHHYISLLSLAATRGEQLGLVEMRGTRVRYPHSIVQAYLGSRFLDKISGEELKKALKDPSRELLIALVLDSRREFVATGMPAQTAGGYGAVAESDGGVQAHRLRLLLEAAEEHQDAKAFDIYAAALEIDSVQAAPQHHDIARSLKGHWQKITIGDRRTIEEAKLGVVHRFGEAVREIAGRHKDGTGPAYQEFFDIGCTEDSYPVRLAIAQEIGIGGSEAFRILCHDHDHDHDHDHRKDPWGAYPEREKELRCKEDSRRAELIKAADDEDRLQQTRISGGGETGTQRAERAERRHKKYEEMEQQNREAKAGLWHELVMRAWLAPMLLGSVGDEYRDEAIRHLETWLGHIGRQAAGDDQALPIRLEVALAQGFKSTANRRKRHPNTCKEARPYLIGGAERMLERSRYWYCQMILIHALCLWVLPDEPGQPPPDSSGAKRRRGPDGQAAANGRGLGPVETVGQWLTMAGTKRPPDQHEQRPARIFRRGEREHPFVAEAGDLAALALESGRPERFIWIDESGVMNKVGSRPARPTDYRKHSLWIPSSAGWSALDRRAQQLLADVLIMLNLTEGGQQQPEERERRLQRANRDDLPPCLTKDRRPLHPGRTIGMPGMSEPDCTCVHGCPFELCPYPPSGALPRAELSEAFCRRQQALLGHRIRRMFFRKTARWQGITVGELNGFWGQMAGRMRPHGPADSP